MEQITEKQLNKRIQKEVEKQLNEVKGKALIESRSNIKFHIKDDVMGCITFEDVLDGLTCERIVNEKTVMKVYKDMLNDNMEDAIYLINLNMKTILSLSAEY